MSHIDLDTATSRRMRRALRFLDDHYQEQPSLAELARAVGLSEFHFQRQFKRWVGISPKRYLQYLTAEHAAALLRADASTLEATYDSGLSSPSRLHDLFVALHAVTPGELKRRGSELTISYGVHDTPFGPGLLAATERGICALMFPEPGEREQPLEQLRRQWAEATLVENTKTSAAWMARVFSDTSSANDRRRPLTLHVRGTNFQIKVWEALLQIPAGQLASYGEIAAQVGRPGAARAVGSAVGANPVSWLIPCHRVIRESGRLGGYRWGLGRKRVMLGLECGRAPG